LSCCKFPKGNPIALTPDVAATIDFFLPVAPKLKNLQEKGKEKYLFYINNF
jgi:hypothetical protein